MSFSDGLSQFSPIGAAAQSPAEREGFVDEVTLLQGAAPETSESRPSELQTAAFESAEDEDASNGGEPLSTAVSLLLPRVPEGLTDLMTAEFMEGLVRGIYKAEDDRMGSVEGFFERFVGKTVGPAQLSAAAYKDVRASFGSELTEFLRAHGEDEVPGFRRACRKEPYYHFFSTAFLLLKITNAWNNIDRSAGDAVKFGIGMFHSPNPVFDAQRASGQETEFDPTWEHLDDDYKDYIHTVYKSGSEAEQEAERPGERPPETATQRKIRDAAIAGSGGSSGQSTTQGRWLSDIAGGDGKRMRDSIELYDAWMKAEAPPEAAEDLRKKMTASLLGSGYGKAQATALIERIEARYGSVSSPTNDEETLQFFGIRRQCVEWANTVAIGAGGVYAGHGPGTVVDRSQARPGMGLSDDGHYMLITQVVLNTKGEPKEFRVADANFGSGWVNPLGEVPWERRVRNRSVSASSGKVKKHD